MIELGRGDSKPGGLGSAVQASVPDGNDQARVADSRRAGQMDSVGPAQGMGLGEVAGLPGFYNCVSSNGYTLAPVLSRLTAEMLAGRSTSLPVEQYSIRRFA